MKKHLHNFAAFLCKKNKMFYLFFATLIINHVSVAQCPVPNFYDSFESGSYTASLTNVPGNGGIYSVSSGSAAVGNFKLEGLSNVTNHLNGLVGTMAAVTPTYISWYIYPTSTSASNYFVFGDAAMLTNVCVAFVYWNGSAITFAAPIGFSYPATTNQWYKIELKNVDYVNHTFDIWINNTLQQTAFNFRSPTQNNISYVHLYGFSAGSTSTWDEVRFGDGAVDPAMFGSTVPCFGDNTGTATVVPIGHVPPLTFTWSNSPSNTSAIATNLTAGVYTVTINDANNCTRTGTAAVTQPATITSVASSSNVACFGESTGQVFVSAAGGTPPFTYLWSPMGGTNWQALNLPAGTYNVVVTDAHNCTHLASATVSEPAAGLTTAVTQTNISCLSSMGIANANPTGGTAPYTYQWLPWGGTTQVRTGLPAGTHTAVIKDANDCTVSQSFSISSNVTAPTVNAGTSRQTICIGESVDLSVTGTADSYSWSTGSASQNITLSPTVTTNYYVIGTRNSNGCTTTSSFFQFVLNCTDIESFERNSAIAGIFPNPTSGEFIIDVVAHTDFMIFNALGEMITTGKLLPGKNNIDLTSQANGIYFIRINDSGKQQNVRIIKN